MKAIFQLLILVVFVTPVGLAAQDADDVLFTVAGEPVTVGEFRYIYGKTNGEQADYSKESVTEYLELYQRFKLKVARAHQLGLDTVAALQNELAGYRRQLADNYLEERRMLDPLTEQLYERSQTDVEFSHILFPFKGNPTERDRQIVEAKAREALKNVTAKNFADKAKELSGDTYSKDKGGRIGYVSVPFPRGLHRLEEALYNAPIGKVVGPVRSAAGYHLLLKHASRPARGEMEVAHLLIRTKEDKAAARSRIEEARAALEAGDSFEDVARRFSEDKKTARNGGYLGFFGINRYDPAFEEAAFALTEDGQVSPMVETSAGLHLIRRISRKGNQPLSDQRPLLEKKVKADGRYVDAREQMLAELKEQYAVTTDEARFGRFAATLPDSTFLAFKWTPAKQYETGPLLRFGDGTTRDLGDLQAFYQKNNRQRVNLGRGSNAFTVAKKMFGEWVDAEVMAYAESRLEQDYYDFAALMREYREGILLFEATKMEVWDKAGEDTTGLQAFFAANRDDYRFEDRAEVTRYTVAVRSGTDVQEVYEFAATNGRAATLERFPKGVKASSEKMTLTEAERAGFSATRVGGRTTVANDLKKGAATFAKIEALLPARQKELDEARGYVIADYQDQLEREWVDRLREEFPIKVNKKVLNKIIR